MKRAEARPRRRHPRQARPCGRAGRGACLRAGVELSRFGSSRRGCAGGGSGSAGTGGPARSRRPTRAVAGRRAVRSASLPTTATGRSRRWTSSSVSTRWRRRRGWRRSSGLTSTPDESDRNRSRNCVTPPDAIIFITDGQRVARIGSQDYHVGDMVGLIKSRTSHPPESCWANPPGTLTDHRLPRACSEGGMHAGRHRSSRTDARCASGGVAVAAVRRVAAGADVDARPAAGSAAGAHGADGRSAAPNRVRGDHRRGGRRGAASRWRRRSGRRRARLPLPPLSCRQRIPLRRCQPSRRRRCRAHCRGAAFPRATRGRRRRACCVPIPGSQGAENVVVNDDDDGLVSLMVREGSLRQVVAMIAETQKLNIVFAGADDTHGHRLVRSPALAKRARLAAVAPRATPGRRAATSSSSPASTRPTSCRPAPSGQQVEVFELDFASAIDVDQAIKGLLSPAGRVWVTESTPTDNRRTKEAIAVVDYPAYLGRIARLHLPGRPAAAAGVHPGPHSAGRTDRRLPQRHQLQPPHQLGERRRDAQKRRVCQRPRPPRFFVDANGVGLDGLIELLQNTTDAKTLASPRDSCRERSGVAAANRRKAALPRHHHDADRHARKRAVARRRRGARSHAARHARRPRPHADHAQGVDRRRSAPTRVCRPRRPARSKPTSCSPAARAWSSAA